MEIISHLKEFKPGSEFFIGVDSDGTAFDSMGIKHKKALIPAAIEIWGLQKIEKEFYEVAEFVNLYSNLRGINRFPGLLLTFEYLAERQDIRKSGLKLPDYSFLKEFVDSGRPMSINSLKEFSKGRENSFFTELTEWSQKGDELFAKQVSGLKPFDYVSPSLEKASKLADIVVISSATEEGLRKDWHEGDILRYVKQVAGQEAGSKMKQLQLAAAGKYNTGKILMIGDAPGDMQAAKANGALFYPINPGLEIESWKRFYNEAFEKFINGEYTDEYENSLVEEFMKQLPVRKPWEAELSEGVASYV